MREVDKPGYEGALCGLNETTGRRPVVIPESQKLEELFVECVIPWLAELTAKQLPYRDKLQVFAGSRLCGNQYVLITLLKLQCLRHVSPLGAGVSRQLLRLTR
jgi:hypothetical protein